jgi:hypothetical protein
MPDESIKVFVETFLRLQKEAKQGNADALNKPEQPRTDTDIFDSFCEIFLLLINKAKQGDARAFELLHWAGLNVGHFFFEIQTQGTPEMQQALRNLAAKHTIWPDLALISDDPDTRRRLLSIGLGKERIYDLESQVKPDSLSKLARGILEEIGDVGSILRAHQAGEIPTRPRLPRYSWPASRLPPFTRGNLPQWWEVASQVFDRQYPDPAKVPWMRALAKNGVSDSAVRAVVKKRLRQKIAGLAHP